MTTTTKTGSPDLEKIHISEFLTSVLWSRLFATELKKGRSSLRDNSNVVDSGCYVLLTDKNYDVIDHLIMGHSPVPAFIGARFKAENIDTTNDYHFCNAATGCVFVGCVNKNKPKLTMVDSYISNALNRAMTDFTNEGMIKKDKVLKLHYVILKPIDKIYKSDTYEVYDDLDEFDDLDDVYEIDEEEIKESVETFTEILLLEKNTKPDEYYDFYRLRIEFELESKPEYFKVDVSKDVILPSNFLSAVELKSNQSGGYEKYIKNKSLYIKIKN